MKRFVLMVLLMFGATRLVPRPACSSEPPGPSHEAPAADVSPASGTPAPSIAGPAPPWFRGARPAKSLKGDLTGLHALKGGLAITRERAQRDAQRQFEQVIADWLALDGVPRDWTAPAALRNGLIRARHVEPVLRDDIGPELDDYKVWYEAAYQVDFAPTLKAAILAAYDRDVVRARLGLLAGIGIFLLSCLAALAGYIRMDEATKGYYTNPLRLIAAAGVGAAGVVIHHLLA